MQPPTLTDNASDMADLREQLQQLEQHFNRLDKRYGQQARAIAELFALLANRGASDIGSSSDVRSGQGQSHAQLIAAAAAAMLRAMQRNY
jgi:hypothetical protein